ncbi:uncharacterized protein [Apostichopus japonicus]|uniref:uncharacterized protein n=1 Tax=Stichopus japonicus TaxID=307972 RepID=UPI003AB60B20
MVSTMQKRLCLVWFIMLLIERRSSAYSIEPNQFGGKSYYQDALDFEDSQHKMGNGDSFVVINDNRMVNFNYKNDVSEVYLDETPIGDSERPLFQNEDVDPIIQGSTFEQPAVYEREDVDGEDVEKLRETGNVYLMPNNGRVPSGIEYDVDGLDYVAHDPIDLDAVAHSRHSEDVGEDPIGHNNYEDGWNSLEPGMQNANNY